MKPILSLRQTLILLVLALTMAGLAGCGGNVRPGAGDVASQGQFDGMIIEAFKDGQFIVNGGVVAPQDLGGHIEYLRDQGKLPGKVLLERSNESKIRGSHLRQFTQLQSKYGFQAYVEHKGKIELLHPDE